MVKLTMLSHEFTFNGSVEIRTIHTDKSFTVTFKDKRCPRNMDDDWDNVCEYDDTMTCPTCRFSLSAVSEKDPSVKLVDPRITKRGK